MSMLVNLNHIPTVKKLQPARQVAFKSCPKKEPVAFTGIEQATKTLPKSLIKNISGLVTNAVDQIVNLVLKIPQIITGLVNKL